MNYMYLVTGRQYKKIIAYVSTSAAVLMYSCYIEKHINLMNPTNAIYTPQLQVNKKTSHLSIFLIS